MSFDSSGVVVGDPELDGSLLAGGDRDGGVVPLESEAISMEVVSVVFADSDLDDANYDGAVDRRRLNAAESRSVAAAEEWFECDFGLDAEFVLTDGDSRCCPACCCKRKCYGPHNISTKSRYKDCFRHLWRATSTDLGVCFISHEEREELSQASEVAPAKDGKRGGFGLVAIQYLSWRRSNVFFMLFPLIADLVMTILQFRGRFAKHLGYGEAPVSYFPNGTVESVNISNPIALLGAIDNPELLAGSVYGVAFSKVFLILDLTSVLVLCASLYAVVMTVSALSNWRDLRKSSSRLRWAFIFYYLSPFIVSFVPYRAFGDVSTSDAPDLLEQFPDAVLDTYLNSYGLTADEARVALRRAQAELFSLGLGAYIGVYLFALLAPSVFSLFPAIIRASGIVRTLVPTSPLPGYVAASVPVIASPILWLSFLLIYQLVGAVLLLIGLFLFVLAPWVYVWTARYLTRPTTPSKARRSLKRIQWGHLVLYWTSMFFLLAFLFSGAFDDIISEVVGDVVDLMQLAVAFVAKYLFTNVVVSDGLVAIIAGLWRRQKYLTRDTLVSRDNVTRNNQLATVLPDAQFAAWKDKATRRENMRL